MGIVHWPPTDSAGSLPGAQTLTLADATTTTAPDVFVIQHTTSGTAAAGFGETSAVELESGGGTTRRVMTDVTKLTTATDGAEVAIRTINLMAGGSLATVLTLGTNSVVSGRLGLLSGQKIAFSDTTASLDPNWLLGHEASPTGAGVVTTGAVVHTVYGGLANYGFMVRSTTGASLFEIQGTDGTTRFGGRVLEKHGAAVASASTLTLGVDGNYFHITGTTTINYLTTANWLNGARLDLYFNSAALTVTNNAGSVPGGTLAFELASGVNITTTAGMKVTFRMDSTQSKWVEISRSA
jgi:hypothetical protein